ncbi:anti-sigma factor family protein [Candidatus Bipolaricaulota bacterium]
MTGCRLILELIPWYANGTLSQDEMRIVTAHLADCEACRNELARTLRLKGAAERDLRRLPGLPDAVWDRVSAEVQGRAIARVDVGSFFLGFSMGARVRRGRVPVYGDLRLLGRKVRLFDVGKEERR